MVEDLSWLFPELHILKYRMCRWVDKPSQIKNWAKWGTIAYFLFMGALSVTVVGLMAYNIRMDFDTMPENVQDKNAHYYILIAIHGFILALGLLGMLRTAILFFNMYRSNVFKMTDAELIDQFNVACSLTPANRTIRKKQVEDAIAAASRTATEAAQAQITDLNTQRFALEQQVGMLNQQLTQERVRVPVSYPTPASFPPYTPPIPITPAPTPLMPPAPTFVAPVLPPPTPAMVASAVPVLDPAALAAQQMAALATQQAQAIASALPTAPPPPAAQFAFYDGHFSRALSDQFSNILAELSGRV